MRSSRKHSGVLSERPIGEILRVVCGWARGQSQGGFDFIGTSGDHLLRFAEDREALWDVVERGGVATFDDLLNEGRHQPA